MPDPRWTKEQRAAIDIRGKNMLVSAAAGSGKTAVLTERIRKLVTDDRAPVSSLLVVTFTDAAAAEMRRRIEDAIGAALEENEGDEFLRLQLRRLSSAQISTFHSFALTILKNYYYIIGMEPAFRVCDEFRAALMKQDALDRLFEESFAAETPNEGRAPDSAFTDFLSRYAGSRGEGGARAMILRVHGFVRSLPEPFVWLDESVRRLGVSDDEFRAGAVFAWLCRFVIAELRRAADELTLVGEILTDGGVPRLAEKSAVDLAAVTDALELFADGETWDGMAEALTFKFQVLSARKEEKEEYAAVKDEVKVVRDGAKKRLKTLHGTYFARPLAEALSDVRDTQPQAAELARLVRRFDEIFAELKRDEGVIDFDDIEHFALAILDDDRVAEELREKYEHVFVDEYQDSNYVQEALLSKVCRADNRFMVGDVKQSIYRFRHAEPGIFAEKYASYPRYSAEAEGEANPEAGRSGRGGNCRVDLNMNFRSKAPIIDAVNGVFSVLMGENAFEGAGGAADGPAYDDAAALRLGLAYDSAWDAPPKLMVIDMAAESEGGGVAATDVFEGEASASAEVMAGAGNEEAFAGFGAGEEDAFAESGAAARIDEEILSLKDVEREALAAAAVIREARGEMFFDAKAGVLRPLDYGDMVVLLREARTSGPVFTETLLAAGIDAYAESGDGYLGTVEIETFLHLLRVIDNARQDIPLVSALYSPVFGFTVNELAEIRMTAGERGGPFYKAFLACAAEADGPGHDAGDCARARAELAAKCAAAAGRIAEWRREESFMELSDFLWLVLKESGWYDYAGALAGGALRQANLLAMTVRAAEYGSGRARGLFGFIRYIESVEDKKLPVPQAKLVTEGENVIRVMTIHKSKGLEYPLVIVAGLGKRLMTAGRGDRLALHREFGLALTREDPESYTWRKTLLMNAVLGRASEEERAELLRVLYVAMTRAQDRLVLIGSRKGAGRATDPKQGATFLDMLLPLAHDAGMELSVATPADLARTISGSEAEKSRAEEKLAEVSNGPEDDSLYAEIDRRLSFVYPHESAVRLKSKYSVSELNKRSVRRQALFYIEESEAAAVEDEGRTAVAAEDDESAAVVDRDVAPDAGDTEAAGARRSAASAAERGVALHKALEKLDFAEARAHCSGMASATDSRYPAGTSNQHRPGDEKFALAEEKGGGAWFDAYLDGLVNGGFLTQQQRASVNADDLMRFASSDICARAAASPRARRETPFNYRMMREGERVIVQGVIDLFFEEGNDLVLVDFKSGGAHAGPDEQARRAAETYGEQIRLYRAALEEITGKRVKESLLYLTSYGRTVVIPRQDRRGE